MKDRKWFQQHLPHKGEMCLLDQIIAWDTDQIHCTATSHKSPANPLIFRGRLGASNAIEYAAQAMAAHGCLIAKDTNSSRQGYIASVRSVEFRTDSLDDLGSVLDIYATRLMGDDDNVIYEFNVVDRGESKVTGRATVILDRNKTIKL